MNQQGDHSNNVQINNAGQHNIFKIEQIKRGFDHTHLEIDENTKQILSKKALDKDAETGLIKILAGSLIGVIGFFSNIFGIASYFEIPSLVAIPWGIGIGIAVAAPQWRSIITLFKLQARGNEPAFIEDHKIVEEIEDGQIQTYHRSSQCIYPNCNGKIILSSAPEREKSILGKSYVGICSIAGRDHSYRIDNIWNAYPEKFDWRPKEQNTR